MRYEPGGGVERKPEFGSFETWIFLRPLWVELACSEIFVYDYGWQGIWNFGMPDE